MIDLAVVQQCTQIAAGRQRRYDSDPSRRKRAAKDRAASLLSDHLSGGGRVLDVGHEGFYAPAFAARGLELVPLQLPDQDMHHLQADGEFDGVVAMHVLEHSPFPLYLLLLFRRALRTSGVLYVAVPHPAPKWVTHEAHFSVLAPDGWALLLDAAGFQVVHRESGRFGRVSREERFVCV